MITRVSNYLHWYNGTHMTPCGKVVFSDEYEPRFSDPGDGKMCCWLCKRKRGNRAGANEG